MSDDDTLRELARLREEVAALSAAKAGQGADSAAPAPEPAPALQDTAAPAAASGAEANADAESALKGQLEELGSLLEAEIRDLPTITCLTVFTLGILLGRMMR